MRVYEDESSVQPTFACGSQGLYTTIIRSATIGDHDHAPVVENRVDLVSASHHCVKTRDAEFPQQPSGQLRVVGD